MMYAVSVEGGSEQAGGRIAGSVGAVVNNKCITLAHVDVRLVGTVLRCRENGSLRLGTEEVVLRTAVKEVGAGGSLTVRVVRQIAMSRAGEMVEGSVIL